MSKLTFELKRKAIHSLSIIYLLLYWILFKVFESHMIAMLFLVATLILFIVIEYFRIKEKKKIPIIHVLWRAKEENTLGGQVYLMLGMIIALGIFEFRIALAAILMMIFGDMAAAIFGIAFGKHWLKQLPHIAWEGIIAEFIVDLIIALFFFDPIIAIPMAFTATLIEVIFPHVDDNLTIPVFAGFVAQGLKLIFP